MTATEKRTTYLGDPKVKEEVIARMRAHIAADELVQRIGFERSGKEVRGCFVGCTRDEYDHYDDTADGLPAWLMFLCDSIHEGLPNDAIADNAIRILEAIPVGADLTLVRHQLMAWLLGPESPSAESNANPIVVEAVAAVRGLHERSARAEPVAETEWSAAARAADSAARSAAESAARSAWQAIASKLVSLLDDAKA